MALHSLKELETKLADQILALVTHGYKIDGNRSGHNDSIFSVYLVNDGFDLTVELHTSIKNDRFTKLYKIYSNKLKSYNCNECFIYYKSHGDVYADTEDEANDELRNYYRLTLGVSHPGIIQKYADKLADYIIASRKGNK